MCKVYFSKKFRLERGKNTSEQKRGEILAGLYVLQTYECVRLGSHIFVIRLEVRLGCGLIKELRLHLVHNLVGDVRYREFF